MVMVVKTVPGNGELRGSRLALLLGYLGDGIETHLREVSGHGRRMCREQDSLAGGLGFQWKE